MGDGTEPFSLGETEWMDFCQEAQAEIDQDIDAALLRVAQNSSLADAVLLAGQLKRGHLFEKHTERCPTHEMEDAE